MKTSKDISQVLNQYNVLVTENKKFYIQIKLKLRNQQNRNGAWNPACISTKFQCSWKIKQLERWSYLKVQYHFGQIPCGCSSHLKGGNFMKLFLYQNFYSYNQKYIHFVKILPISSVRSDTMCNFDVKTSVRDFLFFLANDSPSKTMKNAFSLI